MPQALINKAPGTFKTLPVHVQAQPQGLVYQAQGQPLNFQQMLAKRQPIEIANAHSFSVELANLGVSVRLTVRWQGHDYWVLVRQQRDDRDDTVLKWISGYVPAHELALPLLSALQEVAEECLIETEHGWLAGGYGNTWLPMPYEQVLNYSDNQHFQLSSQSCALRPVTCGNQPLLERPRAYVHTPTASLQLVYDMALELPADARDVSLFHVDERFSEGQLIAQLDRKRSDLFLMALDGDQPTGELFTLNNGLLQAASSRGLWLSESFAEQQGWLVRADRVRLSEWRQRLASNTLV